MQTVIIGNKDHQPSVSRKFAWRTPHLRVELVAEITKGGFASTPDCETGCSGRDGT